MKSQSCAKSFFIPINRFLEVFDNAFDEEGKNKIIFLSSFFVNEARTLDEEEHSGMKQDDAASSLTLRE